MPIPSTTRLISFSVSGNGYVCRVERVGISDMEALAKVLVASAEAYFKGVA